MLFEEEKYADEANNKIEIRNRIVSFIDYLKIDRGSFAEKIKVKPATLSHILTGRNDPSLNIVTQIHEAYPQVSLDWLIYGKGNGPFGGEIPVENDVKEVAVIKDKIPAKKIVEIRVFYDDNTFDIFTLKR